MMHIKVANLIRTADPSGAGGGQALPAFVNAEGVPGFRRAGDEKHDADGLTLAMLRRMLVHAGLETVGVQVEKGGEDAMHGGVLRFDPDDACDPLGETIRDFLAGDGWQLGRLGLLLAVNGDHVVALTLHKGKDGGVSFRYYDPGPSAEEREKLKAQVCQRLEQCGIDMERRFTGVHQGLDPRDSNNSGIYAALAMREMMDGQPAFFVATEDILAWKRRLVDEETSSCRQPGDADAFLQTIEKRSTNCNTQAKRFVERCSAVQYVLDCLPSREAARFQGLNKRLYHEVMPRVMQEVSFRDYPTFTRLFLSDMFCGPGGWHGGFDIPKALQRQFFGWLLLAGIPPNMNSTPENMSAYLEREYEEFTAFSSQGTPQSSQVMKLCEWLGMMLVATCGEPPCGEPPRGKPPRSRPAGGHDVSGVGLANDNGKSGERVSITEIFTAVDTLGMPEAVKKAVTQQLNDAVLRQVITDDERDLVLNNLTPIAQHLASGDMSIDLVVCPWVENGRTIRYVYIKSTPNCIDGTQKPITLYKFRDGFVDEGRTLLLSEKLKAALRRHFIRLGWEDRLGPSFQHGMTRAEFGDENAMRVLVLLARRIGKLHQRILSPNRLPAEKEDAALDMEAASGAMAHLLEKLLPVINPAVFVSELTQLVPDLTIVAFCRISAGMMQATDRFMAMRSVPAKELRHYLTMLEKCREELMRCVVAYKLNKHSAEAYQTINELNAGVDRIEARLALS